MARLVRETPMGRSMTGVGQIHGRHCARCSQQRGSELEMTTGFHDNHNGDMRLDCLHVQQRLTLEVNSVFRRGDLKSVVLMQRVRVERYGSVSHLPRDEGSNNANRSYSASSRVQLVPLPKPIVILSCCTVNPHRRHRAAAIAQTDSRA